ncbi:fungal pheromone STE3G-protein-coupled receptor [Schizopora paradoxa]|uniref:Fungal pheromone STE3G-protein-coupled receptor n=1 Tax=Schizopora paradoxa TaxID=27342 RepID=A0A0H2RXI3_9AGAM|nr:fungal pheromone STE3G-protein-coupled receptor [Schizopora paradoxa]
MVGNAPYPLTPIANFISVILVLSTLISRTRKLNLAVWVYAIWIALFCFQIFVNTIIWHGNMRIVIPVWCDIVTKIQVGANIGVRCCALAICIQLFRATRLRGSVEPTRDQLTNILCLSVLMIKILEDHGCESATFSYVGYIIYDGPPLICSLGCAVLTPITLARFWRHRKEMNEFLSSSQDNSRDKYTRLMLIACLDFIPNVPVLLIKIITSIMAGEDTTLNYPYISWKNVHDGPGIRVPNATLSFILQTPKSVWSTNAWGVFELNWIEWIYVVYAISFFGVFGAAPEVRRCFWYVFWFIPERMGWRRTRPFDVETLSDFVFDSKVGSEQLDCEI